MASSRPLPQSVEGEAARKERSHSGRLLLRMPESLHAELARAADRAGVSLNQFITSALADVVGDRRPVRSRPNPPKRERRARSLNALLAVNLVIVAAAGVVAILLLVSSWR